MQQDVIDDRKIPEKRVKTSIPLVHTGGHGGGRGTLVSLSQTGAQIDDASPLPEPGSEVNLSFRLSADLLPVEMTGEVTEKTEKGFGVTFTMMDRRVRGLLKRAITEVIRRGKEDVTQHDLLRPGG
jgi:hypothetical protein